MHTGRALYFQLAIEIWGNLAAKPENSHFWRLKAEGFQLELSLIHSF